MKMGFSEVINYPINNGLKLKPELDKAINEISKVHLYIFRDLFTNFIHEQNKTVTEDRYKMPDFDTVYDIIEKVTADESHKYANDAVQLGYEADTNAMDFFDSYSIIHGFEEYPRMVFDAQINCLRSAHQKLTLDEFSILVTAYCNNYIMIGLCFHIDEENFGLNEFFSTLDENDIIYCIYKGIYTQDYTWFSNVYKENEKHTIANLYLFTSNLQKLIYFYINNLTLPDNLEKMTWEHFTNLPVEWKEFVIQQIDKNTAISEFTKGHTTFPCVLCISNKDMIVNIMCEDFNSVKEILDVDIDEKNLSNIYDNICLKCGIEKEPLKKIQSIFSSKYSTNYKKVYKYLAEMYSILGYLWMLVFKKSNEAEFDFFEEYTFPEKSSPLAYRLAFLHLGVVFSNSVDKTYILGRYEIYMKEKKIEKLNREKVNLIEDYTHNWKHICYPTLVKDVAETLLKKQDDESITLANKLFKAYNSEQVLTSGIRLLQYSFSDNSKEVRDNFKNSFYCADEPWDDNDDYIIGIKNILDSSLDMIIFRIMMEDADDSAVIRNCRNRIENLETLREDYVEKVLKSPISEINIWKWIKDNNIFDISVNISDEWKAVKIEKNSFAEAQLTEIIVEILTNIFLHGDKIAEVNLNSTDVSMDIIAKNSCNSVTIRNVGSRRGINNLKSVINKINIGSIIEDGVSVNTTETEYEISIQLNKKIIYV